MRVARPIARGLAALVMAAAAATATGPTAFAECPYLPPYPSATEAAPSATEILVGTVLDNVNGQYADFNLRVDHVIRGSAHVGETRRITFLYPRWPLDRTADGTTIAPCQPIYASESDVIALALDALAPDGRTRYNGVSWISGTAVLREPGEYEITTIEQVTAAAQLPRTDTARGLPNGRPGTDVPWQFLPVLAAATLSALLVLIRQDRAAARGIG